MSFLLIASGASKYDVDVPMQMVALGILLLAAYLGGQVSQRLRLSDVVGQMIGGALVGPFVLHKLYLLPDGTSQYDHAVHAFHFFVFVYLCLIAFGIGEELHISRLKRVGKAAVLVSLVHSALTFGLVGFALWQLGGLGGMEAFLLASIATTSAPAITFVLMNQMRIEGHLRHLAGGVLVITDLVGILIFSLLTQWYKKSKAGGAGDLSEVLGSVGLEFGLAVLLGVAVFLMLCLLIHRRALTDLEEVRGKRRKRSSFLQRIFAQQPSPSTEIFIITMAAVSLGTGLAYQWHLPFLITAITAGFLVAHWHSFAIFDALKMESVTPILNLGFFALAGASMALTTSDAKTFWLAGLYVGARFVGKVFGAWAGCRLAKEDTRVCKALPYQLLPQTGVAAVEAVFVATTLQNPALAGIIFVGIMIFGVGGVALVDMALKRYLRAELEDDEKMVPETAGSALSEAARRLLGYLPVEGIMTEFSGEDKTAVIQEMLDYARSISHHHIDREQALQVLTERENVAPTGMGHGIALPHCRLLSVEEPVLVFGRHPEGVVFGGVDDNPCDLILMIFSSGRDPGEHLRIMAAAAHLLTNPVMRHRLRSAPTAELMHMTIMEIAEHMDEGAAPEGL